MNVKHLTKIKENIMKTKFTSVCTALLLTTALGLAALARATTLFALPLFATSEVDSKATRRPSPDDRPR